MGLREIAMQDLSLILEDKQYGFGWDITVTSPANQIDNFIGFSDDISQVIDPSTGAIVSGRSASVALAISSLFSKGFALPIGITSKTMKPWIVTFNDINGASHTFKVAQSNPDRTIGMVTCILEEYK